MDKDKESLAITARENVKKYLEERAKMTSLNQEEISRLNAYHETREGILNAWDLRTLISSNEQKDARIAELERQVPVWQAEVDKAAAWLWRDGAPPFPQSDEWFVAETVSGERVVLRAIGEGRAYDFTTADETYMTRSRIKRWAQFPDSEFIAPPAAQPSPAKIDSELTDELIADVVRKAVDEGRLSWFGFDEDEQGRYTVPVLSKVHCDLARAIEREVLATRQTADLSGLTRSYFEQGGDTVTFVKFEDVQALLATTKAAGRAVVPDGWRVRRDDDGTIVVQKVGVCGCALGPKYNGDRIVESIFEQFLTDMLAAALVPPVSAPSTAVAQEGWLPTPENVNALPEGVRRFVHDLAARCDPAGDVAALTGLRDQLDGVQIMYRKAADALEEVRGCFNAAHVEGLIDALAETTDERLKDLVERRLMHALYAAQGAAEQADTVAPVPPVSATAEATVKDPLQVAEQKAIAQQGQAKPSPSVPSVASSADVRNAALEEAKAACERVHEEYVNYNSKRYPELQASAEEGIGACMCAIESLRTPASNEKGGAA